MIGTILGNRYRILRELGSGGMAWVYLAEDTLGGGFVAVKVLYPQFSQDVAYLQRFVREAKIASALTNPHIVKVLDYGSSRDVHYLVMEYIGGLDLKAVLTERDILNWQESLAIARQVCLALDHASKFGIVHRDIKPQNLMMGDDGVVKVLDFGIARVATMPAITKSGLIGSPYYVSPEQAMGEPVDIRSDLYSLGVVLFELIGGETPFNADNAWSIISQHIADEPRLLRALTPDAPPVVEELLSIALKKKKEDRFQTPADFIRAIDAALTSDHLPELKPDVVQEPVPAEQAVGELYERGLEAARSEQFETALQFFSRVSRLSPGYLDNEAQLNRSLEYFRLEELYAAALQATQSENWGAAVSSLKQIEALRPGYKDTASRLAEVESAVCPTRIKEGPTDSLELPEKPVPSLEPSVQSVDLPVQPVQPPDEPAELPAVQTASAAPEDVLDYPVVLEATEAAESRPPSRPVVTSSRSPATAGAVRYRGLLVVGLVVVFLGGGWLAVSGMIDQARSPTVQQRYEQAMVKFNSGQWDEAIKDFERIQSISPNYEDVTARKEEAVKSATWTVCTATGRRSTRLGIGRRPLPS